MRSVFSACLLLLAGVQSRPLRQYARAVSDLQLATNATYDFIIAGGGIAGLTVADRLTEDPDVSVLVIEYGPFDQREDAVMIPGDFPAIQYLWLTLTSTPQTALGGTSYSVPCGKVVGGGSVVNAMFVSRGSSIEYDTWAQLGATGFGWKDLFPYFKKSETFNRPDTAFAASHNITWDDSVHGFSGPVPVTIAPYEYPGNKNFWNGARKLGIRAPKDPNAGDTTGIYHLQRAVVAKTQTRSSARVNHYDRVIASRPNYHVLSSTAVGRILLKGTKAVGVEYVNTTSKAKNTLLASKEVIIAAGSVHTPQILQLSGIGDAAYLSKFGIKSIVNLPGVGQNLQDHLVLTVGYNFTSNIFPNAGSLNTNATYAAEQRSLFDVQKPSAYDLSTSTGNLFIQLPLSNLTSDSASIISLAKAQDPSKLLGGSPDATVLSGYKKQRSAIISALNAQAVGDISWNSDYATSIYMVRPLSRGSVKINSTDVLVDPLVDFGAGTDPTDIEMLTAAYLKNREIMATPELTILGPSETSPAPGVTDKEAIKAAIKKSLTPTNAHQCCTAAMMNKEDGGVVDAQNRVYGTKNLSIVDASVWPLVVSGGPMGSVYAAAEKAADTIKARHGLS